MSDHFTEDLVMSSIRALDRSARPSIEIREGIAALFRYQESSDCSFTHFRVMDVLLRHDYTRRFEIADHPAYADRRAVLDAVADSRDIHFVRSLLERSDEEGRSEEDGYIANGKLYCDTGTRLSGSLGVPGGPLATRRLAEVITWVLEATPEDTELAFEWYRLGPSVLFADWFARDLRGPPTYDELVALPEAISIRSAGIRAVRMRPSEADDSSTANDDSVEQDADAHPEDVDVEAIAAWKARVEAAQRDPRFAEARRIRAWWYDEPVAAEP